MKVHLHPGDVVRREDTGELVTVERIEWQGKRWYVRVKWFAGGWPREDVLPPGGLTLVREARHE